MSKIYLIAGHSGAGTGAQGVIDEGEQTLQLRNYLVARINELMPAAQVSVEIDEDTDALRSVVQRINDFCSPNDICIDIHFNAFNGLAHGTEVLIPNNATTIEQELAERVLHATVKSLHTRNRGVKKEGAGQHKRLAMLGGLKCHSVLLEVCFCDNRADANRYLDHFEILVENLAEAIIMTYNRL